MERLATLVVLVVVCSGSLLDHLYRQRRDLETHELHIRDLSERSADPYPLELHLEVRTPDGEVENLLLKRNIHYNSNVPVETSENGVKKRHVFEDNKAEYFSKRGAFHVRATAEKDRYKRSFTGVLEKRNVKYFIERDADSHKAAKLPLPTNIQEVGTPLNDVIDTPKRRAKYSRGIRYNVSMALFPNIMLLIDYGVYEEFGGNEDAIPLIKDYYGIIFAGMVQRYDQVSFGALTIMPTLGRIKIITSEADDQAILGPYKQNDTVYGPAALMSTTRWYNDVIRRDHPDIDHLMTFTKHQMYAVLNGEANFAVVGLAPKARLCQYMTSSVIEDDFTMRAIITAAHELGHNLGADHDPSGQCQNHFIMYPYVTDGSDETFANQYQFSYCSLRQFWEYAHKLNRQRANCMTDQLALPADLQQLLQVPGLRYSRDEQCQRYTGKEGATYCGEENVCRRLQCQVPDDECRIHSNAHALHGTPCGEGSYCVNGSCQRVSVESLS